MIGTVTLDWRFGAIELPAADRYIRPAIEITGEYSGAEIDLYQALLAPGDVAVDVGANIGVFSIAMALAVGPAGRVLAFEPQPPIHEILERNLARHGLEIVESHRAIVADAEGEGEFGNIQRLPEGLRLNFGAVGVGDRVHDSNGGMVATPIRSVDGLGLERCALIKIDVEGSEAAVLSGAAATIGRCRPILSIECDRPNAASPWVDGLLDRGYRLWRFRGANLRAPNPRGVALDGLENFTVLMALAVPEERAGLVGKLDSALLQPIDSRATLERLSRRISVHKP